jgi:hypothetical protein
MAGRTDNTMTRRSDNTMARRTDNTMADTAVLLLLQTRSHE